MLILSRDTKVCELYLQKFKQVYSFNWFFQFNHADADENVKIENIGPPEKVIYAFGPELIGQNVEGKVKSAGVKEHSGRTYYQYELEGPHALVSATAAGNRLYLMTVSGNGMGSTLWDLCNLISL